MVKIADFRDDLPWTDTSGALAEFTVPGQIEGVRLHRLVRNRDGRGHLTVLGSEGYLPGFAAPHAYLVTAAPKSIRAWVLHKRQSDRLALQSGHIRVVLYDLRPASATYRQLNVLDLGKDNPALLTIPPFVVHGVQNRGDTEAFFVNMPTHAYDPGNPDKARLPHATGGIPYVFD